MKLNHLKKELLKQANHVNLRDQTNKKKKNSFKILKNTKLYDKS